MKEKVSIIIPIYNVERYLAECLESVIGQTYKNLEIILINDGSKDKSAQICDEYAKRDSRIKVIHQINQGAANAKNRGLDNATGDYVTFIDSDDYADNLWIETMINALKANEADIVECNFVLEYIGRTVPGNADSFCNQTFSAEEYLGQYLDNWTCSLFWNKLFRKKMTEKIRFRYERRCIDDEFYTYKVITGAKKIVRINNQLYHYRQRLSGAVSSKKNELQKTDDALEILIERYEWIVLHFPMLKKYYLKHDINIMFYFAKDFCFKEDTAKKFHYIALYYLKKCIWTKVDMETLKNIICLSFIRKDQLINNKNVPDKKNEKEYFP